MITTVISAKGVVRTGQLSRVEEYIFILEWGGSCVCSSIYNMLDDEVKKSLIDPLNGWFLGAGHLKQREIQDRTSFIPFMSTMWMER